MEVNLIKGSDVSFVTESLTLVFFRGSQPTLSNIAQAELTEWPLVCQFHKSTLSAYSRLKKKSTYLTNKFKPLSIL